MDTQSIGKVHFITTELAERWGMAPGTLANWRINGEGPRFIKLGRRILYPIAEVEAFEQARFKSNTTVEGILE